jgi:hypothetical protein
LTDNTVGPQPNESRKDASPLRNIRAEYRLLVPRV